MIRSRARVGARLIAAAATFSLVLTGCGKIEDSGGQQPQQPADQDTRPIKTGGTLRFALDAEPDKLDPTLSRTLVGREVFQSICETLYEVDEKLEIVPKLAASLPEVSQDGKTVTIKIRTGLKFADGTTMDAAAVKTSLDRHRTLTGSARKSELGPITEITVADPATVTIKLAEPYAPLTGSLTASGGIVMSPTALASGKDFATAPVCIGPFKFATRVAQDRIEVVKDPNYYDADKVKLDKIIYRTIPDATTRLNNLRSGDIDVMLTVSPINVDELKADGNLRLIANDSIGYQGITINIGNAAGKTSDPAPLAAPFASPLSTDARVRRALMLSIDREALNRTVFRGVYTPACGPISPASPLSSDAAQACPPHDPAQAKRLLAEAGVATPVKVSLTVINNADGKRIGEAIKSMATEGGFDIQLEPVEFASALDAVDAGRYQMFRIGWSGLVDADGNISQFFQTKGSQNTSGYTNPEVDAWLTEARRSQDVNKRRELYGKVITKIHEDVPIIYLYRTKNQIGVSNKVGQVRMFNDYLVRLATAGFVE
ncbi:MAG TPA: ABC transporter substrate-binding protein [Actinophytocola sp.]|uniref:ABC transporter substrate-binding protein n=1 Tax=Actinophytocola sp. TaxID=1872138 RepID=UPI002DDD219C|nr:ABC transporter substrate-binding protein [Actinophytocola sp.]HEV2783092.1 ABC transporter substrate-binding protein [Actinophytocola sp.]